MQNEIDRLYAEKKRTTIMAHAVAGYPDLESSRKLVECMGGSGADLIEIQIPFTDPLADGPTIMAACHQALQNGFKTEDAFTMTAELKRKISAPLLLMTYGNIPFRMGTGRFIEKAAAAGASGMIIPDLPIDETHGDYITQARASGIHPILVISPGMKAERLQTLLKAASGFLYITLRVGITGASRVIDRQGLEFIDRVREKTRLPIAAGFGISTVGHADLLKGKVDTVIVGSHLLDLMNREGLAAVSAFLLSLRQALDQ